MRYRIYVPKFHNNKILGIFKKPTNRKTLYDTILNAFKGFTILNDNKGFWKNDNDKVFKDDIEIIEIFTNSRSENRIKAICEIIKTSFNQQSVLYAKDNKHIFV